MAELDVLASNLAGTLQTLKQHLAEFSDADMMVRPVPHANHAAWQMGHLLFFEKMICGIYGLDSNVELPTDAKATYGKEGAASDDAARFLMKDEVLAHLGNTHGAITNWVKGLSAADLAKPGPEQFKGWLNSVGDVVFAISGHMMMHLGQIQVIRRKLGKKIIF